MEMAGKMTTYWVITFPDGRVTQSKTKELGKKVVDALIDIPWKEH